MDGTAKRAAVSVHKLHSGNAFSGYFAGISRQCGKTWGDYIIEVSYRARAAGNENGDSNCTIPFHRDVEECTEHVQQERNPTRMDE